MQDFPCDLCGETDAFEVPHCREYTDNQPIHICAKCGFVHVKSRRSATAIADSWSDDIYGDHEDGTSYTAAIPAVKARHTYVSEYIKDCIGLQDKRLLDIGAGEGDFMLEAGWNGAQVQGIEPSEKNVKRIRECAMDCIHGTVEGYRPKPEFDIVTILWTLENCQDCNLMLEKAWHSLKPGGHVVVATGSRILVPFKKPLGMYLSKNPADTHCFRFSANTLQAMLLKHSMPTQHINRFMDTDYLVVIGQKTARENYSLGYHYDNPQAVASFFDRWHVESKHYA